MSPATSTTINATLPTIVGDSETKKIDRKAIKAKLTKAGFGSVVIADCHRKDGIDIILNPIAKKEMQKQFDTVNELLKEEKLKHKGPRLFTAAQPVIVISDVHYKVKATDQAPSTKNQAPRT